MRYEDAGFNIGEPRPKDTFSKDTPNVWDSVKSSTFHNIVTPHVIQELNHPIDPWAGWPMPKRSRTFSREEFEEFKEKYKWEYGPAWVEASSKIDEIEYDPHMTEDAINYIVQRKNDKEFNDYIISQGRGGIVESVGKCGIEAAISMLDPVISCFYFMTVPTTFILIIAAFVIRKYRLMKLFRMFFKNIQQVRS